MKIGVLTGGGDVPGLNPCIKAIVQRARQQGDEVLGIRLGWAGLLNFNPDDPSTHASYVRPLDRSLVRTIDRTGGTFLHTSRTNPARVPYRNVPDFLKSSPEYQNSSEGQSIDFTAHILRNLEVIGIDRLVLIGGDETLGFGERLHREGMPVIAIPKTMDNDVFGTDFCIGFGTAVTRSVEFIHQLRTTTGSHERIAVIELFGRYSGETALISSYLADVDCVVIPEVEFKAEKLAELAMTAKQSNPSNYAMVAVSEGAHLEGTGNRVRALDDDISDLQYRGTGEITAEKIQILTGEDVIFQQLGYLMRSGPPDALDLMVSVNYANMAMDLMVQRMSGRMCALRDGTYTHVSLSEVTEGLKRVDVDELYDIENYRPKVQHVLGKPMFLY